MPRPPLIPVLLAAAALILTGCANEPADEPVDTSAQAPAVESAPTEDVTAEDGTGLVSDRGHQLVEVGEE